MIRTKQLFLWTLLSSVLAIVGGAEAPLAFQETGIKSQTTLNITEVSSVPESNNDTFAPEETALLRPTRSLGVSNYNSNPTRGSSSNDDLPWCHWQSQFWDEMSTETQENLMALNETADTWNNCMIVETWNLEWLELNTVQRQAAQELGFNPTRWYNAGFFSCDWECLFGSDEDDLYGSLTGGKKTNCLSEFTQVQVLDKGDVFLKDVELGDKVLVSSSSKSHQYQEVYSFGHKDVYAIGDFIQITTTGNQDMPLEITGDHLVMKQISPSDSGVPVRADSIQVGDFLIGVKGVSESVTSISSVKRAGVYSPITTGGTFVANGIVVSSYTALQDKDPHNFVLGDDFVAISHHLLSHSAIAPFRTIMCLSNGFSYLFELRNDQGQLLFAMEGKTISDWIMNQAAELQVSLLTILVGNIFFFYLMEQIFCGLIVISVSALFAWVYSRRLCILKSS